MTEDIKKSVETAKIILKQGTCTEVSCSYSKCPAHKDMTCLIRPLNRGYNGTRTLTMEAEQFFSDFIAKHEAMPSVEELLEAHAQIVGEKAEEVRYFLVIHKDAVSKGNIVKFTNGKQSHAIIDGDVSKCSGWGSIANMFKSYPETDYLEVTAADLPYLEKPEGDWEFRVCMKGDTVMNAVRENGNVYDAGIDVAWKDYGNKGSWLSGYRWCKPRKEGFEKWWEDEGEEMAMSLGSHQVAKIAWENGEYKGKASK